MEMNKKESKNRTYVEREEANAARENLKLFCRRQRLKPIPEVLVIEVEQANGE